MRTISSAFSKEARRNFSHVGSFQLLAEDGGDMVLVVGNNSVDSHRPYFGTA